MTEMKKRVSERPALDYVSVSTFDSAPRPVCNIDTVIDYKCIADEAEQPAAGRYLTCPPAAVHSSPAPHLYITRGSTEVGGDGTRGGGGGVEGRAAPAPASVALLPTSPVYSSHADPFRRIGRPPRPLAALMHGSRAMRINGKNNGDPIMDCRQHTLAMKRTESYICDTLNTERPPPPPPARAASRRPAPDVEPPPAPARENVYRFTLLRNFG
ncbi:hypothetical protein EVAR_60982_1 [Eumeta japonica]|uniref:Uncharacterized protein n=1 Tax=Eumeta variegata TaxID=151549 RepID=A0A4C1XXM2_EUMVA|nr:hypothetical protein EVAR_60982_1 [Eumeta japonica]